MIDKNLLAQCERMENLVSKESYFLEQKEMELRQKEDRLRMAMLKDSDPMSLKTNLKSKLPNYLAAGNVGDINKVIWPFYFTTDRVEVNPQSNVRSSFVVSQEASYVWMSYTKSVFVKDSNDNSQSYLDPDNVDNHASGLKFFIRDPQSQREFFNRPIDIDHVGNPRWPSALPAPQMILPRSTVEVNYVNESEDTIYIPQLTFYGYRIRMENANELLSTVWG